jgi:hypothetical protein
MARSSTAAATKRPPTVAIVVGSLAALALLVGYLAYANFAAPPPMAPISKEAKVKNDRLTELALQSGGDISRLSQEDRNWVNSTTGGYGTMVLRQLADKKK